MTGRPNHVSLGIVRFGERRGSQGWSRMPGWPGPATERHQLLARRDQLPDRPDRFRYGPGANRGRRRVRAAGAQPRHRGRPQYGARRGTQQSGRHASNVGCDAGLFAAVAGDRGPVSLPGDAGPGPSVPGCEPRCAGDESLPACDQVPARLPERTRARARAREASSLLSPERRVPRTGPPAPARPACGPGRAGRSAGERSAATLPVGSGPAGPGGGARVGGWPWARH